MVANARRPDHPYRADDVVGHVLDDRQLLVVPNREPYEHRWEGDEVVTSRPAGGLTAALDRALSMPAPERRRRIDGLRHRVVAADGRGWVEDQLASVAAIESEEVHVGTATYAAVD